MSSFGYSLLEHLFPTHPCRKCERAKIKTTSINAHLMCFCIYLHATVNYGMHFFFFISFSTLWIYINYVQLQLCPDCELFMRVAPTFINYWPRSSMCSELMNVFFSQIFKKLFPYVQFLTRHRSIYISDWIACITAWTMQTEWYVVFISFTLKTYIKALALVHANTQNYIPTDLYAEDIGFYCKQKAKWNMHDDSTMNKFIPSK